MVKFTLWEEYDQVKEYDYGQKNLIRKRPRLEKNMIMIYKKLIRKQKKPISIKGFGQYKRS